MSKTIHSMIPNSEDLLALEPEELAGTVLEHLSSLSRDEQSQLNRYNFSLPHTVEGYPQEHKELISKALMEAWVWLEHEGFLAPRPESSDGWYFITRRGQRFNSAINLEAYRKANILPKQLLHPVIAGKCYAAFLRGDYDTAVFQAYKEVEIATRRGGGYEDTDIGTDLMRKAFHTNTGKLTNKILPKAERENLAHLFTGAIGCYKNPHSHRNISIEAKEAVEMLMLASHLLGIVDSRAKG